MNNNKICFIACVNDEFLYEESVKYIKALNIPVSIEMELMPMRGAKSMCQGYNEAVRKTDARYKVFMHQDVFFLNKNIIFEVLKLFEDKSIGMVGMAGTRELPADGVWWNAPRDKNCGNIRHLLAPEFVGDSRMGSIDDDLIMDAEAIDGIFMATQYDVKWREDLFDGWHFYDISGTKEYQRAGYRTVIPYQAEPWVCHAAGTRGADKVYYHYRDIFLQEYSDMMRNR